MKIAIISDIHADLNRWDWDLLSPIPSDVSTIVVAGDIDNDVHAACLWIAELRNRFKTVIWVAGNHDFYNVGFHKTRIGTAPNPYTVPQIVAHYRSWSDIHDIVFLHREKFDHNGVRFVGATGWHDYIAGEPHSTENQIATWYNCISDTQIKWDHGEPYHVHPYDAGIKDFDAIKHMVDNSPLPTIVITHHIPNRRLLWHKPHDQIWTMLHGSFANTRFEKIADPKIKYWIYGHTHNRGMTKIGDTEFVCNARGYRYENPNWEPIIIEIT